MKLWTIRLIRKHFIKTNNVDYKLKPIVDIDVKYTKLSQRAAWTE